VLAFSTLVSIPWVIRAARSGRLYAGLAIRESMEEPVKGKGREQKSARTRTPTAFNKVVIALWSVWQSVTLFTLPMPSITLWKSQVADCCRRSYFSLSLGQIIIVAAYLAAAIACFTVNVPLVENSNRAGFLAIAQLPVIVLLSLKSPLPLPVLLPSLSYEHYNFLHRWAGRTCWLAATVHGSLWINQYIRQDMMHLLKGDKAVRGMVTYAMLCMVVLTSLKPMRRRFYQVFWAAHVVFFVGFFAAMCYHTPYFAPWLYVCVAIYAYDHFVRLLRYRIKDATLVPVDSTLTMIHIPDCDAGWLPTQHVNVRVLRGAGIFESHPFTITNAPPGALSGSPRGIVLYAKVAGDWTRRLHKMACDTSLEIGDDYEEREAFLKGDEKLALGADHPGRHVTVMIDGPYGGLKMDLGCYGHLLVVAGGSGVTFLLGTIEEALCLRERGRGPSTIDVAWVVRDLCKFADVIRTCLCLTHSHHRSPGADNGPPLGRRIASRRRASLQPVSHRPTLPVAHLSRRPARDDHPVAVPPGGRPAGA
jgi:ferric-chelate reductase